MAEEGGRAGLGLYMENMGSTGLQEGSDWDLKIRRAKGLDLWRNDNIVKKITMTVFKFTTCSTGSLSATGWGERIFSPSVSTVTFFEIGLEEGIGSTHVSTMASVVKEFCRTWLGRTQGTNLA